MLPGKLWAQRACKGRPAIAVGSGPGNQGGKSAALTALHLKLLFVPPLQAVDLGLLVSKKLLKFVLDGLRQLVQLRAPRTCCNTAAMSTGPWTAAAAVDAAETEKKGEDPEDPEVRAAARPHSVARARPPAGDFRGGTREIDLCAAAALDAPQRPRSQRARSRRKLCTLGIRVQRQPPDLSCRPLSGFLHLRLSAQLAARASGKRSFSNPFRQSYSAPPIPLPSFTPAPDSRLRMNHPPRGGALVNPRSLPEEQGNLTVKASGCHGSSSLAVSRH